MLHSEHRKPEPFLTRRVLFLLALALLVTLLFVREYRRQQGPCRQQFHALETNQSHLLRVQDEDNPGDAGPPADPCSTESPFSFSLERAYAVLTLALWAVTAFCATKDITIFRKDRRRRRRRARQTEIDSQIEGGQP